MPKRKKRDEENEDDHDEEPAEAGTQESSSSESESRQPKNRDRFRQRYQRLRISYREEITSPVDDLSLPRPRDGRSSCYDSEVLNCLWTGDEKERFFTALARCGKGNLPEIVRRIGSKSLAEVTAYVGVLEEECASKARIRKGNRPYDLAKVPAAVEVDEEWLNFEDKMAGRRQAVQERKMDETVFEDDDDAALDIEKANDLAEWYQNMLDPDAKCALEISPSIAKDLNEIIVSLTRKLVRTSYFLASSRFRRAPSTTPLTVTVADAHTAIDLLSLPRHLSTYFSTLPSRMRPFGVSFIGATNPYYSEFGMKAGEQYTSVDVMETVLNARGPGKRARSDSRQVWPQEWDINQGFQWKEDEAEQEEGEDVDLNDVDRELEDSDSDLSSLLSLRGSSRRRRSNKDGDKTTLWDTVDQGVDEVLNTETAYLDALDGQWGEIEVARLKQHVNYGEETARQEFENSVENFNLEETTERLKEGWHEKRKQFRSRFKTNWDVYLTDAEDATTPAEKDTRQVASN